MGKEKTQYLEFGFSQWHKRSIDIASLIVRIYAESLIFDATLHWVLIRYSISSLHSLAGNSRTTQHSVYPCYHFAHLERLGNIIVRTDV